MAVYNIDLNDIMTVQPHRYLGEKHSRLAFRDSRKLQTLALSRGSQARQTCGMRATCCALDNNNKL